MPIANRHYHDATVHPIKATDDHDDLVEVTINTRRPEDYVLVDLGGRAWMVSDGKWVTANDEIAARALGVLHMTTRRPPGTPG